MTVQTVFRHVHPSIELEEAIRARAAQLDSLGTVLACRVLIDIPHLHHRRGNAVEVRIELSRRGEDVIVTIEGQRGAAAAIDEAFDVARRRLEDLVNEERDTRRRASAPAEA